MKRLLKNWWEVFKIAMFIILVDIIIPWLICLLPAIIVAFIAKFFTNNKTIIFVITSCVYFVVVALLTLFVRKHEDKQKNSQKDTRE